MKTTPSRPTADRKFSDVPYAGLFGDTVIARVVEEIVADPHAVYHPRDLERLTGNSAPRIREALALLTNLGLLKSPGGKHPAYTVDTSRRSFVALTLLAYAVLDDRRGSDCMETALRHYSDTRLPPHGASGITVSLPEDLHRIVRAHSEVRWSGIARRAIGDYAKKLDRLDAMTQQSTVAEEDVMALDYKVKAGIQEHYKKKTSGKTRS